MVLVTGGTGLVGAHLLLYLVQNNEQVRAIYRNSTSIEKTKSLFLLHNQESLFEIIEWVQADITEIPSLEIAFRNIEFVYHCAALISFDPKDEEKLRKTNIEGTANIVNFCLEYGVKKLCHVSSIAALGDLKENETFITEETEWNPECYHSDYAISKYGAEMEVWRGQKEGLNTFIVNPGVIVGPFTKLFDCNKLSSALFEKIRNGFPFYTEGTSGFIVVEDVVSIMVNLMKSEVSNDRFILVAQNIAYQDVLNAVADLSNVKRPFIYVSEWIVNLAYRIDWVVSNVLRQKRKLDRATAKALYCKSIYSNNKIIRVLNPKFKDVLSFIKKSKLH